MFKKVLIANRGACATRIIRTLKKLDIVSIAVYAEADHDSLHVRNADEAYCLGEGGTSETYLNIDKILSIAKKSGAEAIHPGYGFLSENADFVLRCEKEGVVFVGPTAEQMSDFSLKHKARTIAKAAGVPLSPGTGLLDNLEKAKEEAERIGYPVMLKSTAGGGGIGIQLCRNEEELDSKFDSIRQLGKSNFANSGVYLEKYIARARHLEVQMVGDGKGASLAIGNRDCSSQRRNQKVLEECPAPNVREEIRAQLYIAAQKLFSSVSYRNLGTVEFIYDIDTEAFYFLEVNTRLQVEHGITEEVYGIDLIEWMLKIAAGDPPDLIAKRKYLSHQGHAVEVRLYAEDPYLQFRPSSGRLSLVDFPQEKGLRIETWVQSGVEVSSFFDPMLAKIIVYAQTREKAFAQLKDVLNRTYLYGIETNLNYLNSLLHLPILQQGEMTTRFLDNYKAPAQARLDVIQAGALTTIQDTRGREGYWDVGVPPSGAYDSYSLSLANRLLDNGLNAAGLEITLQGPTLRFSLDTDIVIAGAPITAKIEGESVPMWQVLRVKAGQILSLGKIKECGTRAYLAIKGGIECPLYLGSCSTLTLGKLGGHNGRALQVGDVIHLSKETTGAEINKTLAPAMRPKIGHTWELHVICGPYGAPEIFAEQDLDDFFAATWTVHYSSGRSGIRLIGPKPTWSRADGGEAGLHPSNVHDNAYAFGAVNYTGDVPIVLGPDGPSLGGFVCPATVITADLWKLGQVAIGDSLRFIPIAMDKAIELEARQRESIVSLRSLMTEPISPERNSPILASLYEDELDNRVLYRAAGDHFLLIEYGAQILKLPLRFKVYQLMEWLQEHPLPGVQELTPGIQTLQIHFNSQIIPIDQLVERLVTAQKQFSKNVDHLSVPSRIVYLPLSWDDEVCRTAIEKYDNSVRKDAPWSPSNIEFIRRINGLKSVDEVKNIVFSASYLVMGLGDVYLGAPLALPIDPRHRLVTTKYNPPRTLTYESSVGLGGTYLCIYGLDGPGGYQLIGRSLLTWRQYLPENTVPWTFRFFDQIRFYPVEGAELAHLRREFKEGNLALKTEETVFSMAEYRSLLNKERKAIDQFREQKQAAFSAELKRWHESGQFNFSLEEARSGEENSQVPVPEGTNALYSPVAGNVWKIKINMGDSVQAGDTLVVLESMKMEIPINALESGTVLSIHLKEGQEVRAGQLVLVIAEDQ